MNVIQVKHIDGVNTHAYTFQLPPGVMVKQGTLLLVDTRFGPQIVKAVSDSVNIEDENILKMVAGGRRVRRKVIGIYNLLELVF